MASGTIENETAVTSKSPIVLMSLYYSTSRSGDTVNWNVTVSMHATSSGAVRNNRWAARLWVAGNMVWDNQTIKSVTSSTIGTTLYSRTYYGSTWSGSDYSGSEYIQLQIYDTGYSSNWNCNIDWGTYGGNGYYDAISHVNISSASPTSYNSMSVGWYNTTDVGAESVRIYDTGGTLRYEGGSNPAYISGLSPNSTYTFQALGYASGGWSNSFGSTAQGTTYPYPVSVSSCNISNITPFACTMIMSTSDSSNTDAVEYSIWNSSGSQIWSSGTISPQWSYTTGNILSEETSYVAKFRVRTSRSGVWSGYNTFSFVTLSDQARSWINVNGVWTKGRTYIKINGSWTVAKKIYIYQSGSWIVGTNS